MIVPELKKKNDVGIAVRLTAQRDKCASGICNEYWECSELNGCVFTCNNGSGTVYCKVKDSKGFHSLVRVLSLYSDGRADVYYTNLSDAGKEALSCCLKSFIGIAPAITEDSRLLLEISTGSKTLMGLANVCEDTLFGSVPEVFDSVGVLVLIKQ